MKKSRKSFLLVSLVSVALVSILAAATVAWFHPDARWRAQVIGHKLTGQLADVELIWLLRMMMPDEPLIQDITTPTPIPTRSSKILIAAQATLPQGLSYTRNTACPVTRNTMRT